MVGAAMAKRVCERVVVVMLLIMAKRTARGWDAPRYHGGSEAMHCFDGSCWYIVSAGVVKELSDQCGKSIYRWLKDGSRLGNSRVPPKEG